MCAPHDAGDFLDPIIAGASMFRCHIVDHEDPADETITAI
jgi:hypothetical protein